MKIKVNLSTATKEEIDEAIDLLVNNRREKQIKELKNTKFEVDDCGNIRGSWASDEELSHLHKTFKLFDDDDIGPSKTNSTNTNNPNDYYGCPSITVRGDSIKTVKMQNPSVDGDGSVEKASVEIVEELTDIFMSMMRGETSSDPSITVGGDPVRTLNLKNHPHYNNDNGSLYKIATDLRLNAYEFDILKRIARCRKKGQFEQDLQKIKDTVDLYLKEHV